MGEPLRLTTTLEPRGPAAAILLTDEQVPADLAEAMTTAGVADAFAALAPSHRKEFVRWITEAKRPETRASRVAQALGRIADGQPRR